jgi:GR25 family glycosyltransferase involved in LPS biosynthesis
LTEWAKRRSFVRLRFADGNRGLRQSITGGVSEQLAEYESVIVLEDDIIVSKSFLGYMHRALKSYQEHERIAQVSGYFVPHRSRLPKLGFLRVPACWGWATWRRAWDLYDDDAEALCQSLPLTERDQFNIDGSYPYYDSLVENAAGRQNTWMVRWYASIFRQEMLTLYPAKSLTRNIGFLYGGSNCSPGSMERVFTHQPISQTQFHRTAFTIPEIESIPFRRTLVNFYRWQSEVWATPSRQQRMVNRIKRIVRRFLFK